MRNHLAETDPRRNIPSQTLQWQVHPSHEREVAGSKLTSRVSLHN